MASPYHEGELAVQARAGVQEMARRIGRSIGSIIPPAAQDFLGRQPMAIIGTVDGHGHTWASLVTGEPGFMQALDERVVSIAARPLPGDPLRENLRINDQVGMIAIEPETRRRMRLNGKAEIGSDGAMTIHAQQVYSNCPKYIQARAWELSTRSVPSARLVRKDGKLNQTQQRWISEVDTFFIATSHHAGGVDASHRGGHPGFVRVLNERLLAWPDYVGNMMFQTLGNLAVNPKAGLLFLDFDRGGTLQLTGRADIVWDEARRVGFPGAERVIEFHVERVIEIAQATALRWRFLEYSPFNPKQEDS
jgi:predicted pyridoxine 5'-phosphate oxidase superfamily flavin-nucleotide-binding protein